MLRAKQATLQGHLESAETEQKMNRETIGRMMNDQQNMSELSLQADNLRVVKIVQIWLCRGKALK